jgi:hypothetical protein
MTDDKLKQAISKIKSGRKSIYISKDDVELYKKAMFTTRESLSETISIAFKEYLQNNSDLDYDQYTDYIVKKDNIEYKIYAKKIYAKDIYICYRTMKDNIIIYNTEQADFEIYKYDEITKINPKWLFHEIMKHLYGDIDNKTIKLDV